VNRTLYVLEFFLTWRSAIRGVVFGCPAFTCTLNLTSVTARTVRYLKLLHIGGSKNRSRARVRPSQVLWPGQYFCSWGRVLGVLSSGSILLLAWETERSGEVQVTFRTVAGFV